MRVKGLVSIGLAAILPALLSAKTLYVNGEMESRIKLSIVREYTLPKKVDEITIRYLDYLDYSIGSNKQKIVSYDSHFSPPPDERKEERDEFGNQVVVVTWKKPRVSTLSHVRNLEVERTVKGGKTTKYMPYPMEDPPREVRRYLEPTKLVQSDNSEIRQIARGLVANARTQDEAVSKILNYVQTILVPKLSPPQRDALWALHSNYGNCQCYSHLSLALLRAAGIPGRAAVGMALRGPWSVKMKRGKLTQDNGQGLHAWIEIWYPGLGFLPTDPQQTHNMVSTHLIRQSVGVDVDNIVDSTSWIADGALARKDFLDPKFVKERCTLREVSQVEEPKNFVVSGVVFAGTAGKVSAEATPRPRPRQKAEDVKLLKKFKDGRQRSMKKVMKKRGELGFADKDPVAGDDFAQFGDEYVTSDLMFAQRISLDRSFDMERIQLAMCKFGGEDGLIWVELREDVNGQPGTRKQDKLTSRAYDISKLSFSPKYPWLKFDRFAGQTMIPLEAKSYWIVFRSSGDAIFNWRCQMGNGYGEPDDTRASDDGGKTWGEIFNIDFNFKITGRER
jgi:transglutaminase-like putative cysteine protease